MKCNSQTVDHLVSAIIHGIYAGDTKQLSARSTLTSLYRMEAQYGSIVKGLIALLFEKSVDPFPSIASSPESLKFIQSIQKDNAIYSFKKGMSTIVNGLVKDLGSNPNVTLLNETCSALDFPSNPSQSIKVGSATGKVFEVDRVVSTIPARSLSPLLSDKHPDMALQLSSIPDISVAVVNLLYDESVKLPVNGFGYLIPRSETSASILGVIFDSDSLSSPLPNDSRVRLTVMMGGHSFEKLFGNPDAVELSTLLQTALDSIKEHLGISAQPIDTNVAIHKNAIPQYTIGHTKTLNEIHSILQTDERLRQRLSILGASYTGVGMNDCIFATRQLARNMQRSPQKSWSGLEGVL